MWGKIETKKTGDLLEERDELFCGLCHITGTLNDPLSDNLIGRRRS